MKQWKRLAALSSAIVMAAATLTYFPNDTLQNIRLEISASAEDASAVTWTKTESDGLTWTLYEDGTLNISGTGEMRGYNAYSIKSPACDNSNIKNVVIEDGITSIGNNAFYGCSLTNIRIPGSVTSIGKYALEDCMSLTSVTIPGSVSSIGEYAFSDCRNLTDATILDGVTSIENRAFWGCSSLTSVTIPNSVTNIGESAFWHCSELTSVTIPDGVTSIEDHVFAGCYSLTSITIPNSVTSIGNFAFRSCTELTSITIPDGVISIGNFAFSGCNELTSITIPDSVTSIGDSAFEECRILTSISIPDSVTSIGSSVFNDCFFLKTISLSCKSTLKRSDFEGKSKFVSYTPHTLKKVEVKAETCTENGNKEYWTCEHCGKYFLSDDTNPETAKAVELSETVISASHKLTKVEAKAPTCTENGNKEYWTCEHCGKYFLSDDANPETAKAVEQSEFIIPALNHKNAIIQNASEPTETAPGYSGDRYCPDCDTVFEKGYTYWNEGNLTWKLYADGTLNISGTGAMKDYNDDDNPSPVYQNSNVKKVVIEKGVTSIGNYAFSGCLGLKSITIPDGITSIGDHAFDSCINLRSITLPDSITSIGMWAFYNCWNVPSIIIPDGVTSIEDFTFDSCIGLTSITIPNSIINIKSSAFHNCAELASITIPDSVTSIGESVFGDCSSLTTISLSCKSSLKRSDFGKQADLVSYTSHTLNKTEAKAATCTENGNKEYWTCEHCGKYFLSDDTNPETAKAVEQSECMIPAIQHKNAITRGAVEPTETDPGYSGDRYCPDCNTVLEKGYTYWIEDNLTWKLYEDGTLNISGTGAMKNYIYGNNKSPARLNLSVTSIVIEEGVTSIGDYAFENCDNLTSITIPGNVESIGESAFYSCDNLTDVTLQDGVKSIGDAAFIWCNNLTNIVLPNSITSIGDWAFKDCTSLTSIKIPSSVTSIHDPFYNCFSLKTISLDCDSPLKRTDFGKQADLVSYTPHTLIKTEAKPVTDDESGNKEYWTCSHCGKYFLSDDTNPETATAVELSEIIICNHKNAELRNASEPTETSPGYSGDLYCPDCDKVVEKGYTYWIEDNLTWKLYEDGTLNISGTGAMKDYDSDDSPATQKKDSVKKVVIEDDVTSIGNYAFSGCSSLTDITLPSSVTSIKSCAFYKCSQLASIEIPSSVTSIGNSAFRNCTGLTSITIPESVTSIGDSAFRNCTGLTSITISDRVTSIGNYVFWGCSNLTSIVIPDSVTSIGELAFSDCSSLTSITIPDSVTSIGYAAFSDCSSLKIISLSCKSTLKKSDFGDQADLVSYTSHTLKKTEAKAATCTENGNKEYWTCEHCKKYFLSDDSNPETAKAVEQSETVIPASHKLTKVEAKDATCAEDGNKEYWTCEHCKKYFLSDDTNPETATAVEQSETIIPALKHKNATTRDAVEPNGTKPGYSGDRYCPDCDTVLEKGYTYWNEGNLTWKLDADGTLNISGTGAMKDYDSDSNPSPIYNNSDVKEVVIEDGVTSIGNKAFDSCSSLTSITIPNSVTSIKAATFYGCTSLTSITIPDSVTSIGYATFTGCSSLTSITIPDSVTSIGYATFAGCSSLTSITIPDSVTSIGESAFSNCSSLQTISLSCKSTLKRSDFGDQADLVSYALHTLKKTEAKAATYAENGNKEYWTCEHCGKYFLSDDTNPETAKAVELSETVIPALVQIATTTTPIKCVYGQDMNKIDLRDYVKNTDVVGEVTVKVAIDSTLPDGMKLDGSKLSGKPAKAYEDGKEVTFTFTAENGNTANLTLLFLVAKADPTVEVSVSGDSHTEGDLVSELKLILSENSTKGVVELVSEIKTLVAGKNTFTWKFTPEDENNYNMVTGTVVVNAQTTTTTTTTTKATTTTKPNKTTTTKATTTTKPSKTTTTNATTATKPSKTTTTNVTTTTKPSKTTTTKVTTTTKPSKTTTTNATTTTKPSKTTTTKVTTTNTAIPSYGDVNLDGKVDIVDAIFLNKYLATLIQFSDAQMANADCCQDGVLNDQDTTALMQFIILLIDDLPVQPTEK